MKAVEQKKFDMIADGSIIKNSGRFWHRWFGWIGRKKVHREIKDRLFRRRF